MTKPGPYLDAYVSVLRSQGGFRGPRKRMWRADDELQWLVTVEYLAKMDHIGLVVGCVPLEVWHSSTPTMANDCPVVVDPVGTGSVLGYTEEWARHLTFCVSNANSDERIRGLQHMASQLVEFIDQTQGFEGLRARYRNGDFRYSFVRKELRPHLATAIER